MKNAEQPAYPYQFPKNEMDLIVAPGLTKREYIATKLMAGMLSNSTLGYGMDSWPYAEHNDFDIISAKAVRAADELLKQLEK